MGGALRCSALLGRKFTVDMQSASVTSSEEVWARLDEGLATRAVGVTNVNAHSSRSHLVFTLNLDQREESKPGSRGGRGRRTVSKLVLVDLAGSERVGKSEATGVQLVEAQHINRCVCSTSRCCSPSPSPSPSPVAVLITSSHHLIIMPSSSAASSAGRCRR
jgi:hypothetical protein